MKRKKVFTFWAIAIACVFAVSASEAAEAPKRVQPPEWSQDVLDAFFEDARDHLVGERPTGTQPQLSAATTATPASAAGQGDGGKFKWSSLIDAEALTAEIRRVSNQLAVSLRKSTSFQGGGNLTCRRDFGSLSVLFGVIAEFDEDVRWQRTARLMQQRCFSAGENCRTASSQTFAAAQAVHAELAELLRGQAPAGEAEEGKILLVDRTQLMQVMEHSLKEQLGPSVANSREFRKRSSQVRQQSQVLAVLAEVIQQEGYEYADDDAYLDEARQLREAARELAEAASDKNYDAVRAAAGKISQSCSRCHEGYRG